MPMGSIVIRSGWGVPMKRTDDVVPIPPAVVGHVQSLDVAGVRLPSTKSKDASVPFATTTPSLVARQR